MACDVEYLVVGLPGDAVPYEELAKCLLPTVSEMVQDSMQGARLFSELATSATNAGRAEAAKASDGPGAAVFL